MRKIIGIVIVTLLIGTTFSVFGNLNNTIDRENDSDKFVSIQSLQNSQPDIMGKESTTVWKDMGDYNTINSVNAFKSFPIIKIYYLRVENDGPHYLNGTVSIQLANHTYPKFIAILIYQKYDGTMDFRILTNLNGYIITDFIKGLQPSDFTDMRLIVFSQNNIFNNQDFALVKAHEGHWSGALRDALKLI
jgi:hypothetical protein